MQHSDFVPKTREGRVYTHNHHGLCGASSEWVTGGLLPTRAQIISQGCRENSSVWPAQKHAVTNLVLFIGLALALLRVPVSGPPSKLVLALHNGRVGRGNEQTYPAFFSACRLRRPREQRGDFLFVGLMMPAGAEKMRPGKTDGWWSLGVVILPGCLF